MTNEASNELKILISQLVEEAHELVPTIIEKTRPADERAKLHKLKRTRRHRLHVLLEAAQRAERSLPQSLRNPWFLAEFKATVGVIRRWHDKPIWKEIEPSLVDPNHFPHTIAKLHIAEHLQHLGHSVRIVPRGKDASPDLTVQVFGMKEYLNIECYQPERLVGQSMISTEDLKKIVDRSMEKAKRQLEAKTPGMLAICGFNQPKATLATLKETIAERFQQTERPNLCGILTVFFSTLYDQAEDHRMFTPMMSVDFVPNPSYFGRIVIGEDEPKDDQRLIKGQLRDLSSGKFVLPLKTRMPSKASTTTGQQVIKEVARCFSNKRLKLIKEPAHLTRAVVHSKETLPLFKGEGNTNYICGRCGVILAERAWKFSISNIVVECPSCHSFNEFPRLKKIELPIYGSVGLAKGDYYFSDSVVLRRGACLVGL